MRLGFKIRHLDFKIKDAKKLEGRDRFIMSMKTTSTTQFRASTRLKRQKNFNFIISIILSLGLILIPLTELAGIPNAFQNSPHSSKVLPNALNGMQIFLAIWLLVYSIIIGTARYEIRSQQLNDCANKIKNLIRQLRNEKEETQGDGKDEVLDKYNKDYDEIVANVENREHIDYHMAVMEMHDYYDLSMELKLKIWIEFFFTNLLSYSPALLLLIVEVSFITDMFGLTYILIPYLDGGHLH